jgi:U3 small nucleolar RNA-associated protein 4
MHVERPGKHFGKSPGTPPALLATIKINSSEHIVCSAISGDGCLVAFSDSQRPRLYELEPKIASMGGERGSFHIRRKKLPAVIQAAHCMVFSADSSRLLIAGPRGLIWVRLLGLIMFSFP